MSLEDVPPELRGVADEIFAEFRLAAGIEGGAARWLSDYEVLELRAAGYVAGEALEVYLPRPLIEDLAAVPIGRRKRVLAALRRLPRRAADEGRRHWLLGDAGEPRALRGRPFEES